MTGCKIIGTAHYLPEKILTNQELEKMVETSDDWITTRTGIKERHIAAAQEASSDMGIQAAQRVLVKTGIDRTEIDGVICATITPDHLFPSTASLIQKALGLTNVFAFDLSAACSGFLYAISVGESLITQGKANTILIVASEKLSSITDWQDRATCVLFGDGAGAIILQKVKGKSMLLSSYLRAEGKLGNLLILPAGGSRKPASEETIAKKEHFIKMDGNEVFKHAVQNMLEAAKEAVKKANLEMSDIALMIPHQANLRIVEAISKRLHISKEKIFLNLQYTGNTSAASIAIALSEADEAKRLKKGDKILLISFGAGFTWAGMVIQW